MLVKFETNSYPAIVMFDHVAKRLINLMGHSGAIPSAINAKNITVALHNLQHGLKKEIDMTIDTNKHEENEYHVGLEKRAIPLIELLQSAEKNEEGVMWDAN